MITPFDPAWPEIPRRPAQIEPMEAHVRLSVGVLLSKAVLFGLLPVCLLAYFSRAAPDRSPSRSAQLATAQGAGRGTETGR